MKENLHTGLHLGMDTHIELPPVLTEIMEEMISSSFNSPLFQQEDEKGITYRIPALLYVPPTCTFLAFAEKRSTSRDEDALYLVLRPGFRTGHSVQVTHPRSRSGLYFSPQISVCFGIYAFSHQCWKSPVWGAKEGKTVKIVALTVLLVCQGHVGSSQLFCILGTVLSVTVYL